MLRSMKDFFKSKTKMQQSRIFLLTDGQVGNRDQVIQQAKKCRDTSRIFTFGIGSGADEVLV